MARSGKKRVWFRVGTVIAILLSILLGWELVTSMTQLSTLQDEKLTASKELERIEKVNEGLEEDIKFAQTDEYIIRMARKVLGWVFPDDIRIVEDAEP